MEDVMKALRKNVMTATPVAVATRFAANEVAANENLPATATRPAPATNVALLVAAPLVGLAYVLAMPVIGIGMLAWIAMRPVARHAGPIVRFLRNAGLFLAAPFIGLAYALAFPFVGIGMLAWKGARAAARR
jgi:hypothetical protein